MSFLDIDAQKSHIRWAFVIMIVICFFIIYYTVLSKRVIKDYILSKKEYNIFNFLAQEKQKSLKDDRSYKDLRLYTDLGIICLWKI